MQNDSISAIVSDSQFRTAMLTILLTSPIRIRRSSFVPFCASSTFSLTVITEIRRKVCARFALEKPVVFRLLPDGQARLASGHGLRFRGVLEDDPLRLLLRDALLLLAAQPLPARGGAPPSRRTPPGARSAGGARRRSGSGSRAGPG